MKALIAAAAVFSLSLCPPAFSGTSLRDLPPSKIIGTLGKPLGERMIIEGVSAERAKNPNSLRVSSVDGEPLESPIMIEVKGDVQLSEGTRFRLEGYESCYIAGVPAWTVKYPECRQTIYGFRGLFVVTQIVESQADEHAQPDAAHEPPPAAAVRETSEDTNTNPESEAPVNGGGR